jgi:hypothetical protein
MSRVVDLGALGGAGFAIQGDNAGDQAGFSVTSVGDFNGDGFDDVLVGVPFSDVAASDSGAAYLIYGKAGATGTIDLSNLPAGAGFMIRGAGQFAHLGMSAAAAGDVNRDGLDDLLLQTVTQGPGGYGIKTYVIFGKTGTGSTIDLNALAGSDGFLINGPVQSGSSARIAPAGDVNGDGFDDIIIGAPSLGNYAPQFAEGSAYVIFGRAGASGTVDVTNLGDRGFKIDGDGPFHVGESVAAAGDVNGDGFDDILVTARWSGFYYYGSSPAAYVIFGKQSGFGTIALGNLKSADGIGLLGAYSYDNDAIIVAGGGDINGDGFADILIGSPGAFSDAGRAYVVFGGKGLKAGDITQLAPSAGFTIIANAAGAHTGFSLASAGDVNGDGYTDLIVGSPASNTNPTTTGGAYVLWGGAAASGDIDLATLPSSRGFLIAGAAVLDAAGFSVSGGDINADGFSDLIVGAPFNDGGGTDAGRAYVVYGRPALKLDLAIGFDGDFNGDGRSDILWRDGSGQLADWLANTKGGFAPNGAVQASVPTDWRVAGAGDFDGDGRDDVLWRHRDGTVTDWLANASAGFNANNSLLAHVPTDWKIAGIGDFNGDGRDDILWRHTTGTVTDWLAREGGFDANAALLASVPAEWTIAGIGDFNGDGRDDILWRRATGTLTDWLGAAGGGFVINDSLMTDVPIQWAVAGIGDFNGDGKSDILWRQDSGRITDWLGNALGGFSDNWTNAARNAPLDWSVEGIGDYDGDGKSDILWRHDAGQVTDWLGTATGGFTDNWNNAVSFLAPSWHVQPEAAVV